METKYYRIEWGGQCDRCPVQKQCTRSKSGRRILVVGLRHDLVQKRHFLSGENDSFLIGLGPALGLGLIGIRPLGLN